MRKKAELLNQYLKNKNMSTIIEGIKFYTISETAKALRVTPQTIRAWIKQGKINSQRIGRPILITENNLKEFLQANK
jgi:excisionase family DNA binding protein